MLFFRGACMLSTRRIPKLPFTPSVPSTTSRVNTLTCRRTFHLEGLVLAPVVFSGLFVALWTWKCFMMVIFQNHIIYMPWLPPNARREKIEDYARRCGGIQWRQERVRATDGTDLALCLTDLRLGSSVSPGPPDTAFYILYFQGNASSIPPRLPDLSSTLCMLKRSLLQDSRNIQCTMVCLSYRGYWTSRGRPNEKGLRIDAAAALDWISQLHLKSRGGEGQRSMPPADVVLWGQSIGAGVATNLAAEYQMPENIRLNGLVLETPFTSIRAMLQVIYPQKWLPYQYLWPFLRNHLDSSKNIEVIAQKSTPEVLILEAAKDELVPAQLSQQLYDKCLEAELPVVRKAVTGAFHNDVIFKSEGRRAVADFMARKIMASPA
ncbi:alpha/beta-hydrolase [Xylariaceae sp. FL0662B]|nr:alpha/beta-hydrolase [Xylariaceae sp. FL0662B]